MRKLLIFITMLLLIYSYYQEDIIAGGACTALSIVTTCAYDTAYMDCAWNANCKSSCLGVLINHFSIPEEEWADMNDVYYWSIDHGFTTWKFTNAWYDFYWHLPVLKGHCLVCKWVKIVGTTQIYRVYECADYELGCMTERRPHTALFPMAPATF